MNTLVLSDETFEVKECKIWGYVGKKEEAWYIRWCVYVACEEKTRVWIDDGEEYSQILKPSMEANTLPIEVAHWHDLDGVTVSSGPNVDFEYLDPNDSRPIYSIFVYEHNKCSNNVISFSQRIESQFRVRWSGTAYTFGPGMKSLNWTPRLSSRGYPCLVKLIMKLMWMLDSSWKSSRAP